MQLNFFLYQCFQPGQTTNQNEAHSLLIHIWVYEQKSSWKTSTISAWSSQPKFDPISGLWPTWRSCAIISAKKIGLHKIQIFKTPTYMLQITIGIIWNPYYIFMINTTAIHTLICWPTWTIFLLNGHWSLVIGRNWGVWLNRDRDMAITRYTVSGHLADTSWTLI